MSQNTGTIKIEIQVDDKGTVKVKKFGDQSEKAFRRTGQSVGDFDKKLTGTNATLAKMGSLVGTLVGVYGLMKLVSALNDCVKAASDLEEVTSKFNVVFEGQAKKAEAWAQALVDGYAMSTREARQYLSSVQDLLVPMGMEANAAAYLSNEIVKLSADLGSFNNLPTAQVMGDIQSALVGNYETMKKYGVVVNATIVQEKALAMGLAKTKDQLTVAQKAFAAYTLMLESSKAAVGDMARTSGSYANQIKAMKANVENLKAEIGTNLLPALSGWLVAINAILKAWNKLFEGPSAIDLLEKKIGMVKDQIKTIQWSGAYGFGDDKGLDGLIQRLDHLESTLARAKLHDVGKMAGSFVGDIRSDAGGMPDMSALTGGATQEGMLNTKAYYDQIKEQLFSFHDIALAEDQARQQAEFDNEAGHLERMKEQLGAYHDARLEIMQAKQAQELQLEFQLREMRGQVASNWLQTTMNVGNAVLAFSGKQSKAIFAIAKAAEVAKATIAAFTAFNLAMANPPGPPWTLPLAASVLAMGLANAAAIGATAIGTMKSGGGGAVGTYAASPATGFPTIPSGTSEEKKIVIIFKGDSGGNDIFMDHLIEKLNDSVEVRGARVVATELA